MHTKLLTQYLLVNGEIAQSIGDNVLTQIMKRC